MELNPLCLPRAQTDLNLVRARPPRSGHVVLSSLASPGSTRTPEIKRTRVMAQNAPEVATQRWFQPDDAQGVGVADSGRSDARVAVRSDDLNLDASP